LVLIILQIERGEDLLQNGINFLCLTKSIVRNHVGRQAGEKLFGNGHGTYLRV